MKILSAAQVRQLDQFTIKNEPISSIDLMERAASTFVQWFLQNFPVTQRQVCLFCGPGNNGGDGLAVARMLENNLFDPVIYRLEIGSSKSADFSRNQSRLSTRLKDKLVVLTEHAPLPSLPEDAILIDAIFGSGLNRPVTGYWATFLQHLNQGQHTRVAIDIPSGLFADAHSAGISFQADYTFSFEFPKMAFMFLENEKSVGHWVAKSIGLSPKGIAQSQTSNHYITKALVRPLLKKRTKFSHKGTYGHALLICGSKGMMGAAILAAKACLRSGVGLLSVHVPASANQLMHIAVPEAMLRVDHHLDYFTTVPETAKYSAIGIGCGLGKQEKTGEALENLLKTTRLPLVIDADALNLIAAHNLLEDIPNNSILTPHPKEFERLFGKANHDFERLEIQRAMAQKLGVYILSKTAHTAIACPDGKVFFNSTGNPGMATAGSGDVLTGMLTGLLAQGYAPETAAIVGVFLHGLAGDLAAEKMSQQAMLAGDIVDFIGAGFLLFGG